MKSAPFWNILGTLGRPMESVVQSKTGSFLIFYLKQEVAFGTD